MTNVLREAPSLPLGQATEPQAGRLKFAPDDGFQKELRRRVETLIKTQGIRERDCPRMYIKTALVLAAFFIIYGLLVFVAQSWWQALPLAVSLGLAVGLIGINIQHDG